MTDLGDTVNNIYNTGTKYFHANSTGADSEALGADSVAIGMGAVANNANDIALGAGSVTGATTGTAGVTINGEDFAFAGAAPASQVSVGSEGNERLVTNVAAGHLSADSTDAVNGSQLFATNTAINSLGDQVDTNTTDITNIQGDITTIQGDVTDLGDTVNNIYNTGTKYFHANSTGADSQALGADSVAIGMGAVANNANDIALGAGSVTGATTGTAGVTLQGVYYTFAGANPASQVSVGSEGNERLVTNVAAGHLSADSTDAINGSQLFATNQAINGLDQGAVKYDTHADGTVNYNSVTLGGDTYDNSTHTGGTTITNVADGVAPSDAVNFSQLTETNNNVTVLGDTINNFAGDQSETNTTINGRGIRYVRTNDTGLPLADAYATGAGSTAVGYEAQSQGDKSLALGNKAVASAADGVALGSDSVADTLAGISGYDPETGAASLSTSATWRSTLGAVSVGDAANGKTRQIKSVAAGSDDTDAVNVAQLKNVSQATTDLGDRAVKYDLNGDGTVNYNHVTMGGDTYNSATHTGGTRITNVADGIVDSDAVNVSQLKAVAGHYYSFNDDGNPEHNYVNEGAIGQRSMAAGIGASAVGDNSIVMGVEAQANGTNSLSVGYGTIVNGDRSGAFGDPSIVNGNDSYSLGNDNTIDANSAFVIGNNVSVAAGLDGTVVLGNNSTASAAVATTGTTIGGVDYSFAGTAPQSTVSIGAAGAERTLTNLAAGRISAESTDAINGSQLFATHSAINTLDQGAVKYDINVDGTVNYNSITLGGDTYDNSTHTGGTTITNVADGVAPSDAVNFSQLTETNNNITNVTNTVNNFAGDQGDDYTEINGRGIRYVRTNDAGLALADAYANGQGSTAVGYNARSTGLDSLALGRDAQSINDGDVALGSGSVTDAAVATTGVRIQGVDYEFAGINPLSTVSVGSLGHERTITNVAAGRITADSTDAINGSQLFATNTAINGLEQGAVKYDTHVDGTVNYNSITLGGDTYDNSTHTGGTTITNVADGVAPSDAVNFSQLTETNNNITNVTNTVNNFAGDQGDDYTEINGRGIRYVRTNDAGLALADAYANGQGSTAVGYNARSTGLDSLALGRDAQSINDGDVALGSGSVTEAAVATTGVRINDVDYGFAGINPLSTVSVGSRGHERTITNVAAGRITADSTDAINGSQLFATNSAITSLDQGTVKYEINEDGTVNYNHITLGGDTYNSVTKTGGTRITNVAYGSDPSDAVNVQQLTDATTNIYNNGTKYFHANSDKADSVASGMDSIAVGPNAQSLGDGSIAMGDDAKSTGKGSTAIGQGSQTNGENSVAVGTGSIANNANDVALGAGSVTQAAVATTSVTINGEAYAVAGTTPTSTVSVGSEGNERTITNVAAGRITADSTDAVNGSELYATNQAIEKISGNINNIDAGSVKYETNSDGTVNYNKVIMGGDTYDNSTHTGGTTITNVANGEAPSDAVNKYQLDQVNQSVTNISNGTDGMFQVNNTSNLPKPKPTGKDAVAGGAGAIASADHSTAIGTHSKATHTNSVALGYNSVTDRDNSVSVGSVGNERQITNVAAGTQNTDAVNVGQLKDGVNNSYQYTNKKFNDLKNMVDDQKDKLSAGVAGAMAMAGLPQPYQPGASMVGLAGGTYQGESAIALGVSTISDNGKWVTKISGTTNSQGDVGAAVGVGYQF